MLAACPELSMTGEANAMTSAAMNRVNHVPERSVDRALASVGAYSSELI